LSLAKVQLNREIEEFYDLRKDPNALNNLINDPKYQGIIAEYRQKLRAQMEKTQDPALEAFDNRYDKDKVRKWLEEDTQKAALAEKNVLSGKK
jgi:N-sulfoglucosamine sulfohydrolase